EQVSINNGLHRQYLLESNQEMTLTCDRKPDEKCLDPNKLQVKYWFSDLSSRSKFFFGLEKGKLAIRKVLPKQLGSSEYCTWIATFAMTVDPNVDSRNYSN
nr:hypothetical protein [Tanacetum cinerariifolium]